MFRRNFSGKIVDDRRIQGAVRFELSRKTERERRRLGVELGERKGRKVAAG